MSRVKCSVDSCSYNQNGGCFVPAINVGGRGAIDQSLTCCGTYMNKAVYSNLAEFTSMRGEADEIMCRVDTCKHYGNGRCSLDQIQIGGQNSVGYYSETNCLSFEM